MTGKDDALLAAIVLGSTVVGLGLVLLMAGDRTRTTLSIGSSFLLIGPNLPIGLEIAGTVGDGPEPLVRFFVVLQACAMLALTSYVHGLAATSHASAEVIRRVDHIAIVLVAAAAVFLGLGLISPALLVNDVLLSLSEPGVTSRLGFWIYVPFWLVVGSLYMYAYFLLSRQRLDRGERTRAVCAFLASPMLVGSQFGTPVSLLVLSSGAMLTVFFGMFRNAVAQGERGAYLSRFLSPQVAAQVRLDGLTTVMRPGEVVLTVVACDLRGFTAYAEGVPSQAVIDLLGEYYRTVGTAVAEVDGTIKDYAGDGILILVGAPLPRPDHASAGLTLARRIHEVTGPVLMRWATGPHPLGIGVGVATGRVTVGAIGSDARMEYSAVGTPVNLAARLCAAAADGEILLDEHTRTASDVDVEPRGEMSLKGMSQVTPVFACPVAR